MSISLADHRTYLTPALAKSIDLVVERGQGSHVWTVDGDIYFDWVQDIALNALSIATSRKVSLRLSNRTECMHVPS